MTLYYIEHTVKGPSDMQEFNLQSLHPRPGAVELKLNNYEMPLRMR